MNQEVCGYKIEKELGKGTYGTVNLINDPRNQQSAAIKVIKSYDREKIVGFSSLLETDILSRFQHPNLMSAYFILTSRECHDLKDKDLGMVMPIADMSLISFLFNRNTPDIEKIFDKIQIKLMHDLASGLLFLHENRILHLDLKLENIVIFKRDESYDAVLIDFGLSLKTPDAIVFKAPKAQDQQIIGVADPFERITEVYRAPELLDKDQLKEYYYTDRCDVWALALLYLEIIMRKYLFGPGETKIQVKEFIRNNLHDRSNYISDIVRCYFQSIPKLSHRGKVQVFDAEVGLSLTSDLLSGMLQIDPKKRSSIVDVINHPFFSSNGYPKPISGQLRCQEITSTVSGKNSGPKSGIDFILNNIDQSMTVDTLFLAIDIYHRGLHFMDEASWDFSDNFILIAVTAIMISYKIHDRYYTKDRFLEMNQKNLLSKQIIESIEDMESALLKNFHWIISRKYLYDACRNVTELIKSYPLFYSPDYLNIDLDSWIGEVSLLRDDQKSKNILICDYFNGINQE